jgi:hypothetical protein
VMIAAAGSSWTSGEVPIEVPAAAPPGLPVDDDPAGET